jgi:ATP-dependent DNA helicase RecQ
MNDSHRDIKLDTLFKHWGFASFRNLQENIIDQVLQKQDVLALLPTGGGKSICYQLPAIMMEGVCIVVSPLIALMEDQVNLLQQKSIKAELINSSQDRKEIDRILDNCIYGEIKLLYISPERIHSPLFKERFKKMNVSFVAIDEAHCISQWGNDFRPNYRNIAVLKQWKTNLKFIALTATATKIVANDIQDQLLFDHENLLQQSFLRENIIYKVIDCDNKRNVIKKVVNDECTIIYVRSRKKAEEISNLLKNQGKKSNYYHAGLKSDKRSAIQQKWINNEFNIMVATNAFGMGIDKSDVRTVIHFDLPESIESFYQESGRAGRDGTTSYSIVLRENNDEFNLISKIKSKQPDIESIRKVFQHICNHHQIPISYQSTENFEVDFDLIANKTKVTKYQTYHILQLLIKDGYLIENNSTNYFSKIKFNCSIPSLNHFLNKYPSFETLVDMLMRSYAEIFKEEITISETLIAQRLNITTKEVNRQLNELCRLDILNYSPKKKSYGIQFHSPRPNINKLSISKKILINQKNEIQKAIALTNYSKNKSDCRNKILLEYFDDKNIAKCNSCDNCTSGLKTKNNPIKVIKNAIKIILKYENKSPKQIYIEFEDVVEKKVLKNTLKEMLNDEIIRINKENLVQLN